MIDVSKARKDTPSCVKNIHLNNAGASLIPLPVQEIVSHYQQVEYDLGGYEAYDKHIDDHNAVYGKIGRLIGADAEEIVITTSASHSYGLVLQSLRLKAGDKILCCYAEYTSNYMALLFQKELGVIVELVPNDEYGQIDLIALEKAIDNRTILISLTHIPTSSGLINPAEEVGKIAARHGVLYLLDACQSVGQIHVDVNEIGCHFLAVTGRKYLRGPRGTGFLFVKKDLFPRMTPPLVDGWSALWPSIDHFEYKQGRARMELYEKNYAAILGLGEAAAYASQWGTRNIEIRNLHMGKLLREKLRAVTGVTVRDHGKRMGAIVTFTMDGKDAGNVLHQLRDHNIHVSVSTAAASRLDLDKRGIHSVVRASVHYYNEEAELDRFVDALKRIG